MPQIDTRHASGWTTRWGLRNWQDFYLDRPDQLSISEWRKTQPCGFHTTNQNPVKEYDVVDGGMVIQLPTQRSFSEHLILRPKDSCWPAERIHTMGGFETLLPVYSNIILPLISERKAGQTFVTKFAGKSAGMSQPDDHTHLLFNPECATSWEASSGPAALQDLRRCKLTVAEAGNVRMVCYPVFSAGQCWLVAMDDSATKIDDVLSVLCDTNALFAEKFRSKQDQPPDWSLHLRFVGTRYVAGHYTPRITTPGVEQAATCLFNDIPVALQCPPEDVMEILRVW